MMSPRMMSQRMMSQRSGTGRDAMRVATAEAKGGGDCALRTNEEVGRFIITLGGGNSHHWQQTLRNYGGATVLCRAGRGGAAGARATGLSTTTTLSGAPAAPLCMAHDYAMYDSPLERPIPVTSSAVGVPRGRVGEQRGDVRDGNQGVGGNGTGEADGGGHDAVGRARGAAVPVLLATPVAAVGVGGVDDPAPRKPGRVG